MSYIMIKQNDAKTFKAFLSGREIEIGVVLQSKTEMFGAGEEIEIFYGNNSDTYKAKITRQKRSVLNPALGDQSMVMLGLLKR